MGNQARAAGRPTRRRYRIHDRKYTDVFTNASLGWPAIAAIDLPSGGPSPPLAAMGTRLRADVSDNLTLIGAVFDGNAAGPGTNDPQLRDRYGVNFRVNDPPLVLGEAQFLWNAKKGDPGLDGKFKVGGWRHFGDFSDQRFDSQGLSLANPASSRDSGHSVRRLRHLFGLRAEALPGGQGRRPRHRNIRARFIKPVGSQPDQSLRRWRGGAYRIERPAAARQVRRSRGYARVSSRARALDGDYQQLLGPNWPVRSFESLITTVYQYEVRAGFTLQPNFQYIVHPGGGATGVNSPFPGKVLKDAAVFGLRTVLKF